MAESFFTYLIFIIWGFSMELNTLPINPFDWDSLTTGCAFKKKYSADMKLFISAPSEKGILKSTSSPALTDILVLMVSMFPLDL
jgi:hypothetical protein